jgi:hypothetical protein
LLRAMACKCSTSEINSVLPRGWPGAPLGIA